MIHPQSAFRPAARGCLAFGLLLAFGAGAQQPDAPAPASASESAPASAPVLAPAPLKHWATFTGAWLSRGEPSAARPGMPGAGAIGGAGMPGMPAPFGAAARARAAVPMPAPSPSAQGDYVQLQQPAALAARANILFLADAGRRFIFRYDVSAQRLTALVPYAPGGSANIALAPDFSLYVAEAGGALLQYGNDGRLLRTFGQGQRELGRPVAIAVDEAGNKLAVADSLYRHVVLFSNLGQVLNVYQPEAAQSVDGMVRGPDGLYLLDRLGRRVVVIGWDGAERYTLGEGQLKLPGALTVDRFNRVFVSDGADRSIKVFVDGALAASYQGEGGRGFTQVSAMTVDQNLLYVADAMGAQVQTLRIAPPPRREQP